MRIDKIIEKILNEKLYNHENHTQLRDFFYKLSDNDQLAVISAMYIGRNHLHLDKLKENISRNDHDHIELEHFYSILVDKSNALPTYFETFLKCARASKFDFDEF